jgi:hypothetical protein
MGREMTQALYAHMNNKRKKNKKKRKTGHNRVKEGSKEDEYEKKIMFSLKVVWEQPIPWCLLGSIQSFCCLSLLLL